MPDSSQAPRSVERPPSNSKSVLSRDDRSSPRARRDRRHRRGSESSLLILTLALALPFPLSAQVRGGVAGLEWSLSGDYRVRYEYTGPFADSQRRQRQVLRLRTGVGLAINDRLEVGARLVTGDPQDPRTSDVTISRFLEDLEVSLDRAYLAVKLGTSIATAGKFQNPFLTTELVWDNDVNPAGAAGVYKGPPLGRLTPRMVAMFMVVDEQTSGRDSWMWGSQAQIGVDLSPALHLEVAGAYWHYTIGSLANAGAGNIRGNFLTPDGLHYLSTFHLADVLVVVEHRGLGERYPIRAVADYVKNLGAKTGEDEGLWVAVSIGDSWIADNLSVRYGYAQCETDAVLGTFTNDNLPLATNYRNHTLRIGYGLLDDTELSLTWYLFRTLELGAGAPAVEVEDDASRFRLDLMVRF